MTVTGTFRSCAIQMISTETIDLFELSYADSLSYVNLYLMQERLIKQAGNLGESVGLEAMVKENRDTEQLRQLAGFPHFFVRDLLGIYPKGGKAACRTTTQIW